MSEQPLRENPIAVENVRNIMLSVGIDLSSLPERTQKIVMDYMVDAFDWYTSSGADFGNAILRAWDDILKVQS